MVEVLPYNSCFKDVVFSRWFLAVLIIFHTENADSQHPNFIKREVINRSMHVKYPEVDLRQHKKIIRDNVNLTPKTDFYGNGGK